MTPRFRSLAPGLAVAAAWLALPSSGRASDPIDSVEECEKAGGRWDVTETETGCLVKDEREGRWIRHDENGQRFEQDFVGGEYHGRARVFYPSGKLKEEGTYRDSALHGRLTGWYEHGGKRFEETLVAGKSEGEVRNWMPSGQLELEERFVKDLREGPATYWHPTCYRSGRGSHRADKRHGKWVTWHPTGAKRAEGTRTTRCVLFVAAELV